MVSLWEHQSLGVSGVVSHHWKTILWQWEMFQMEIQLWGERSGKRWALSNDDGGKGRRHNRSVRPHGTPLFVRTYVCLQEKSGPLIYSLYYKHKCLINHHKTHQTPNGPKGSPMCPPWSPGTPWDSLAPPRGLMASLNFSDHLNCLSNHQKTQQMSLLILWDI